MSASESMATPVRPTSPRASGSSESSPSCVGRSNATERPVWPRSSSRRKPLVRLLGRREPGVLAHRPRPRRGSRRGGRRACTGTRPVGRPRRVGRGSTGDRDADSVTARCRVAPLPERPTERPERPPGRAAPRPVRCAACRSPSGCSPRCASGPAGRERELDLPDGARVGDVWPVLELGDEPPGLAYARNREYAERDDALVDAGDEVAVIPPVSGGAFTRPAEPLDLDAVVAEVADPRRRRDRDVHRHHPRRTAAAGPSTHLEYDAYPEMAEAEMARIAEAVRASATTSLHVAIAHRTGPRADRRGERHHRGLRRPPGRRRWTPATRRSTRSSRPCRCGRRRSSRAARSGSDARGRDIAHMDVPPATATLRP